MVGGYTGSSDNTTEGQLAKAVGTSYARFQRALQKFGVGAASWIIYLLPKIPVQVIVYEGDEEFPATVRILAGLFVNEVLHTL